MALAGVTRIGPYLGIAILIGIANACEAPARQSLIGAIVEERALLPSAIGFNSVLFNTGRMIGPAIAGVLLRFLPEGICFTINAVSFAGIIGALIAMRLPDAAPPMRDPPSRLRSARRCCASRTFPLPAICCRLPRRSRSLRCRWRT